MLIRWVYVLMFSAIVTPLYAAEGIDEGKCTLMGIGELFVPGLGYGLSGQYNKAIGFGATRYFFYISSNRLESEGGYQDSVDDYFHRTRVSNTDIQKYDYLNQSDKDKVLTFYSYNKATFNDEFYNSLYTNLGFYSYWDLTEGNCAGNPRWKEPFLAFGDYTTYLNNYLFIGAATFITLSAVVSDDISVWHLGDGLTYAEVQQKSLLVDYSTGIGEETFFRGSMQKFFYQKYKRRFDIYTARHLAIFSAAGLFGVVHSGQGGTANSLQAFLAGVYLGYTYQPEPEEFQLSTAIVLHTLVNGMVTYRAIKGSREVKHLSNGQYTNTKSSRNDTQYRLLTVQLPF